MESLSKLQLLFQKYLQQQCTKDELEELIFLLKKEGSDDAILHQMEDLWQQQKDDDADKYVDWDAMYARIKNPVKTVNGSRVNSSFKRVYTSVAAAAAIIILASSVFLWSHKTDVKKPVNMIVKKTEDKKKAQHQTINLPDGSTVVLNDGSKLNYPAMFSNKSRVVYLIGEGYFDIKHDPKKMFIVHAGKLTTEVLGTAFNIKAYPGDDAIQVTVTRGKVQVIEGNKSVAVLVANQQITYNNKSEIAEQRIVNTDVVTDWKPAEIVFDDITMEEAANRINKRFNTTVDFDNTAIKICRVSATFSADDKMDEMLDVICAVSKANYTIKNNKVIIYGKGCN